MRSWLRRPMHGSAPGAAQTHARLRSASTHARHARSAPLRRPLLGSPIPSPSGEDDEDPFLPAGFVSAFSLERHLVLACSASAFSGLLAELGRALAVDSTAASSNPDPAGPMVSVNSLSAYLQIVDVASILRLDRDIADHAFELFKDCSSASCLRNRSSLEIAALVQAIREAQQPRTLQCLET